MNRFKNYLDSAKLAKILLRQAEEHERRGEQQAAFRRTREAVNYLLTAMNNLASLFFQKARKP